MTKKLLASVMAFALCQFMLATDMIVKQKNGEIKKFNVEDVEEVIFNENSNIPNDSTVVDASETLLRFDISSDSTAEVTGLKIGGVDELIIPAKVRIDGKVYTVTSIKDFAFDTNYLGSVMIPSSITELYDLRISTNFTVSKDNPAFSSLDGVLYDKEKTKVIKAPEKLKGDFVIPASVTIIQKSAFSDCRDLTSIKIPEGVTSIGAGAFGGCGSLTSIKIPEGVTSIGAEAFSGCGMLEPKLLVYDKGTKCYGWIGNNEKCIEVVIPEGVTSIGEAAFENCINLTSINVPEGVTNIGAEAFYGCFSLANINIPEGVTSIGAFVFRHCNSLASVDIPAKVTIIGNWAFSDCGGLTSINIPEGVTSIGNSAFYHCGGLTSIKIPEGVTSIGTEAFCGCSNLDVTIDNSKDNVEVGKNAFGECKSVTWLKE
ncbi:MAG: leucine-rich repeat domain-containing protein [Paludibacteraceae bacterium]|nr:leucine-rich repeat domain-containing protein [Paludibacteraceae bacterium]